MSEYNLPASEISFDVPSAGKPCATHYWVSGDLKSGATPLIVAHGGPGCTHDYVANICKLSDSYGIPVILYDQIGNGLSTHLPEKNGDTSFWTVQLFIDELDNLIEKLGIGERYDLLGHSWGGMLASSFAVRRPKGLRRLVLSSSTPVMKDWMDAGIKLQAGLPQEVQDQIAKHEKAGTTTSKEYEDAIAILYERHTCRVKPMPAGVAKSFEWLSQDPTVYHTMNGPSEFFVTGPLKDFNIVSELPKINVTTLITNGRYDGAQDSVVRNFFQHIPKVKWVEFAESSHVPHHEEPQRFLQILGDFLAEK